jgi:hypothetical protein
MSLLMRKRIILAKEEVSYGTDPTPTGAANAILVRNLETKPFDGELVARNLVRPYLGNYENLTGAFRGTVDLEVELAGSGAAGTAPKWGPLLKACGMNETLTPATDATYAFNSDVDTMKSLTLYVNHDGVLHEFNGARGNFEINLEAKQIPFLKFSFVGLFVPVVDGALPTADYSGFQTPLTVNDANTPNFTLHGFEAAMQSFSFDAGNQIVHRSLVNSDKVLRTDRLSSGACSIEAVPVATKDWWTLVRNNTLGALNVVHGVTPGNIVQLTSARVQLIAPEYSDSDSVLMTDFDLSFIPSSAGNDEFSIVVK